MKLESQARWGYIDGGFIPSGPYSPAKYTLTHLEGRIVIPIAAKIRVVST